LIRWREQVVDVGPKPIDALYATASLADVLLLEAATQDGLVVWIPESVRRAVLAHLRQSDNELGGLLIGEAFERTAANGERRVVAVRITEAISGEDYASSAVALRLETSVWTKARTKLVDGRLIVGWYHSHPHIGAFFSATDRRTQRAFFAHPYSVGWVIDPYADASASSAERLFVGPEAEALTPERVLCLG
jgi:proteasome lid subunit RPN8/RPN11